MDGFFKRSTAENIWTLRRETDCRVKKNAFCGGL